MNTILTAEQAARYTMEYVLGKWAIEAKQKIVYWTKETKNKNYLFNQQFYQR